MDQHGPVLHVLRKISDCPDGKICPAVITVSTQPAHTAVVGKVSGTAGTVYIPDELTSGASGLPAAPDRPGYRIMTGDPVSDPHEAAALAEHVGPGEAVILVPNDQIPEVLDDVA